MKTTALIEKGKDGTFSIYTVNLNSTIIGEGNTVEEAKEDFLNSVTEVFECYTDTDLPEELKDLTFEYKYDIPSLFNSFNWINVSKFAETIGINPTAMRQYKAGNTYISRKQIEKIEKALHELGAELIKVSL